MMKRFLFLVTPLLFTTLLLAHGPVLKTAQTKCYDTGTLTEISCSSTTGQDGNYQKGIARGYIRTTILGGRDYVLDTATNLTWQDDEVLSKTWQEAIEYCPTLGKGWRLPKLDELQTLLDYSKDAGVMDVMIDDIFQVKVSEQYWSITARDPSGDAHVVSFEAAFSTPRDKGNPYSVRCVIGTKFPLSTYRRNNALKTVYDSATDLTWQDDEVVDTIERSFDGAIAYCEGLDYAGKDDWRLPNINELAMLATHNEIPAIDTNAFTNTASFDYYWSSTFSANPIYVRTVNFSYGDLHYKDITDTVQYVRCVRNGKIDIVSPAIISYILD